MEAEARDAEYVIVTEPSEDAAGHLKTRRKGLGEFRLAVEGKASHAGANPGKGISAIHELAHQVLAVQSLARPQAGTTVNVGLINGGTARNTVPAYAEAMVDVRVKGPEEAERVTRALRAIRPVIENARITVEDGFHRPPMLRTPAVAALAGRVKALALELGTELGEASSGGGSDANLTAALGVPTVDGMGAVGKNPHAEGENVVEGELVRRCALLAHVVASL